MQTLSPADLLLATGGAQRTPPKAAVCNRQQFDWMAAHMVPDNSMRPGVQRHVITHDAKLCGFPMPGTK